MLLLSCTSDYSLVFGKNTTCDLAVRSGIRLGVGFSFCEQEPTNAAKRKSASSATHKLGLAIGFKETCYNG